MVKKYWRFPNFGSGPTVAEEQGNEEGQASRGAIVSRRSLVLEVIISVGLCAAVLTGLVLTSKGARREHHNEEKDRCLDEKRAIASLGRHIAMDARQLGGSMMLAAQRDDGALPFLLPGEAVKEHYLELQKYGQVLYEDREVKAKLYVAWYPTVLYEDRDLFEAHMSEELGRNVSITQIDSEKILMPKDGDLLSAAQTQAAFFAPAGPRPVYNPMAFVWGLDAELIAKFGQLALTDGRENMKHMDSPVFLDRVFGPEGLPIARRRLSLSAPGRYDFFVTIPFCGLDVDCSNIMGFFTYGLLSDDWDHLFRRHTTVLDMEGGEAVTERTKTGSFSGSKTMRPRTSFKTHESFLDLTLVCHFRERYHNFGEGRAPVLLLLWLGAFGMVAVVSVLTLVQWREINDAEAKGAAHRAARETHRAAREEEASRIAALDARVNSMEATERYIDHEVKNRLMVLEQIKLCETCAKSPHKALVVELMETITTKSTLLRLATQRYTPRLEDLDFAALVQLRVSRYNDVDRLTTLSINEDHGKRAYNLSLDKTLVSIILDNLISNAHKYGDAKERPPHVAVSLSEGGDGEVKDDDRLEVVIRVSNAAGAEHGRLLKMGEAELNRIALKAGERAHVDSGRACKERSAGDGFPMSVGAANCLGGSLRLLLREEEVVAELRLGNLERAAFLEGNPKDQQRAAVGLVDETSSSSASSLQQQEEPPPAIMESLTLALVDDCKLVRRMFACKLTKAFATAALHLHGDTHTSIDHFATSVVTVDADVVFVDQNFGKVNEEMCGTDIVRRIRQLDDAAGRPSRLIFVISANDSTDDLDLYSSSGADAHVPKTTSSARLRSLVLINAKRHQRRFFAATTATCLEVTQHSSSVNQHQESSWSRLGAPSTPTTENKKYLLCRLLSSPASSSSSSRSLNTRIPN